MGISQDCIETTVPICWVQGPLTVTVVDNNSSLWRALDILKIGEQKYPVVNDREQEGSGCHPRQFSFYLTSRMFGLADGQVFLKPAYQLIIKPTSHAPFSSEVTVSNWKCSCRAFTGQHPSCLCHLSGIQPIGHRRLARKEISILHSMLFVILLTNSPTILKMVEMVHSKRIHSQI